MALSKPPAGVPVQRSLSLCAPKFAIALVSVLNEINAGHQAWPFETFRTEERQAYLYGFGRTYDDGRGVVTQAQSALYSWHGFGLACDVVDKDGTPWEAPASFWNNIGITAERYGLVWGGRWKHKDLPHVQWGKCPVSPSDADRLLFREKGKEAVWLKYGAA